MPQQSKSGKLWETDSELWYSYGEKQIISLLENPIYTANSTVGEEIVLNSCRPV